MQGVLLALTKTSNLYQSHGPEAALIEAFRSEYSRLVVLANSDNRFTTSTQPSTGNQPTNTTYPRFKDSSAQIDGSTSQLVGESKQTHTTSSSTTCVDPSTKNIFLPLHTPSATPSSPCTNSAVDLRLEHVLVYLLRAGAPKKVVERSLLEAFASPALSQHPWCVQVMRVAQARLKEIRPEDMDLDEYQRWLNAYASFRKAAAFLHSGLVLFLQKRYESALPCLLHAYRLNRHLTLTGPNCCLSHSFISRLRRLCLMRFSSAVWHQFSEASTRINVEQPLSYSNCYSENEPESHLDSQSNDCLASKSTAQGASSAISRTSQTMSHPIHLNHECSSKCGRQRRCNSTRQCHSPKGVLDIWGSWLVAGVRLLLATHTLDTKTSGDDNDSVDVDSIYDRRAAEAIRREWCLQLETELEASDQQSLSEFLSYLLDCAPETEEDLELSTTRAGEDGEAANGVWSLFRPPPLTRPNSPHKLAQRLATAMERPIVDPEF
uniref:ubiquitin carboxyl-terminal hydrolase 28-like n=2 Tax=Myxine glutinosa TaxID=7769 RepID=UPI00358E3F35